jgi:hypothetical protein
MNPLKRFIARMTLRDTLAKLTLLAWALWLGAMITAFVLGTVFFAAFSRDLAGPAANAMFHTYSKVGLVLAGICLLSTGMLLVTYPNARWVLVLGCLVLTTGMAITVALGLMPMMDALIDEGKQHSPEFIKLHVKSMIAMTMQTGMLLVTGAALLGKSKKFEATEPADETQHFKSRNGRMFAEG